ncbi:MAG: hypothetical protein JWP61_1073 [Friedmanniella sp.]|nr:hypothetical protein [Friedmanniella sp.]
MSGAGPTVVDQIVVGPPPLGVLGRLALFVLLGLGLGGVGGVVWQRVVHLPTYLVNPDGGASTTERGLTGFFGGDAWFVAVGAVVGVLLGVLGWRVLRGVGWPLVLVVTLLAVAAGLVCWLVGYKLGPGDFAERLAAAQPGDEVPIELTLRAKASLLAWPFMAVVPVLLGSSLSHDADEPR